jgi:TolB-like protein
LVPTIGALADGYRRHCLQRVSRSDTGHLLAVVLRSGDTNSASLAKEFSKELIHLLGRVSAMDVLPRSEVLKWETSHLSAKKIGQALGTKTVLLGTVERLEDDFRLPP